MLARDQERIANLNFIYIIQIIRTRKAPFYELVKRFRERGLLQDSIRTCVEKQAAMFFLHIVGHNQKFRVMHNTFRRSIETIFHYFNQVLYVIGELKQEIIKPPSGETPNKIRNNKRWYPYFKVSKNNLAMHTTCGMAIIGFCPKYCYYCPNDKFYIPGCIMENKPCGLAPIRCMIACRKASSVPGSGWLGRGAWEDEAWGHRLRPNSPHPAGTPFCSPGPPRSPPTPFSHNSREKLTFVGIGRRQGDNNPLV
jgi:hypothetical protein